MVSRSEPILYMTKYLRCFREQCCRFIEILALFAVVLLLGASPALAQDQMPTGSGSVLNILMLGVIAYFLVRMFRRRMGGGDKRDDNTRPGNWSPRDKGEQEKKGGQVIRPMDRHEAARQMWGHLSSDKPEQQKSAQSDAPQESQHVKVGGFDEAEFLEGAKLFFSRFHQANESRDFDALKDFLSDEVYADAVLAAQNEAGPTRMEIMLLNAKLMEVKSEGKLTRATVFYDGQMRKGQAGEQVVHVRAVWEFSRDDTVKNGLWTLDTINKVDQ